jgi:hypothetical protein
MGFMVFFLAPQVSNFKSQIPDSKSQILNPKSKSKAITAVSRIRPNPFSNLKFQIPNPKSSRCLREFLQVLSQISNLKFQI